ncbi:MAG: YccF domain-containing protein [Bacilli bacterium]|nr:YccF domain-containing protein [Bacilli bacterium]
MKILGNLIWFVIVGILSFIIWVFIGILWCVTIIGIPFGKQCFKLAGLTCFPFGKEVKTDFDSHPVANIIWLILFGWEIAVGYVVAGLFFYITIIGIPFGKQCFKLATLSLLPFGSKY